MYYLKFKRLMDIIFSITFIILLSPLLIVISFLVYFFLGEPILFKQKRPGLNGTIFTIIKFRTMKIGSSSDSKRLNKFGKIIRSLSIDELPELLNILKGDMSFIGPRPLLVEYLPLYNSEQNKRHNVRPGISGLAQINGRNKISWEKKFNFDIYYVENLSFWLDLTIILKTVSVVFKRQGITDSGNISAKPFNGKS